MNSFWQQIREALQNRGGWLLCGAIMVATLPCGCQTSHSGAVEQTAANFPAPTTQEEPGLALSDWNTINARGFNSFLALSNRNLFILTEPIRFPTRTSSLSFSRAPGMPPEDPRQWSAYFEGRSGNTPITYDNDLPRPTLDLNFEE